MDGLACRSAGTLIREQVQAAVDAGRVLLGLAANALLGWWWADPVVALLVVAVVVQADVRTWRASAADTRTSRCPR